MGSGTWTTAAYNASISSRGIGYDTISNLNTSTLNQFYTEHKMDEALNPYNKIRECVDSEEHPETVPVILALDVTGSMGSASAAIARKLDDIMTSTFNRVKDVEFMVMGIGDIDYDKAPIQVSQFESDERISEWLGKIWQEHHGGGNNYESYTAAWYYGLHRTKLDCWKRGKKGIIITMGDENLNPVLKGRNLTKFVGNLNGQAELPDVRTSELYHDASEKFDIFHIMIDEPATSFDMYGHSAPDSFKKVMGEQHVFKASSDDLVNLIPDIILSCVKSMDAFSSSMNKVANEWANPVVAAADEDNKYEEISDDDGIGW